MPIDDAQSTPVDDNVSTPMNSEQGASTHDKSEKVPTSLLEDITDQCIVYMILCGDISEHDAKENRRGWHWFCVTGVDRQISSVSHVCNSIVYSIAHKSSETQIHKISP